MTSLHPTPESGPLTLRDRAQAALEASYRRIVKLEPELLVGGEAEALARIGSELRRLQATVLLFEPALDLPKRLAPRRIAKAMRPFRALDRWQALLGCLERLRRPGIPDAEQEIVAAAIGELETRRDKGLTAVRSAVADGRYPALRAALGGWLQRPRFGRIAQLPIDTVLPDLILPAMGALLLDPGWLVGAESVDGEVKIDPDLDGKTAERFATAQAKRLETLRRTVQRLRYQVEALPDARWAVLRRYAEDLETVQRTLGTIGDLRRSADYLRRFSPTSAAALPEVLHQLTRDLLVVWREWQPIQRWFLSDDTRSAWRLALLSLRHPEPDLRHPDPERSEGEGSSEGMARSRVD